jgi:hypothetical protein
VGAVLVPVGIVVAASLWSIGIACSGSSNGCFVFNIVFWPVTGAAAMITGIGLLGYAATHRLPADANRVEIIEARARPRLRFAGLGAAPTRDGFAGAAAFTF